MIMTRTMKRITMALLLMLPLAIHAQDNTWEMTEEKSGNPDQKYLVGAVPEKDGRVVFETTIKAPRMTRQQIFDRVKKELLKMTKESNQLEQSRLSVDEPENGTLVGSYQEWLVFKNKPLVLDRTRFFYNLVAECSDGELHLMMNRIYYIYDEERNAQTFKAEEWITDKYGLKKNMKKLSRVSGKFRRKTIDRKDYLFNKFENILK